MDYLILVSTLIDTGVTKIGIHIYVENDMPVGFALVRKLTIDSFSISEFFISHSFRRRYIATQLAHKVFNLHYGK